MLIGTVSPTRAENRECPRCEGIVGAFHDAVVGAGTSRSQSAGTADFLILTCLLMKPDKVPRSTTLSSLGGQTPEKMLVFKVGCSAGKKGMYLRMQVQNSEGSRFNPQLYETPCQLSMANEEKLLE